MQEIFDLETLITRISLIDLSQGSEQATREIAVNPIIGALGWDTMDPEEVSREFSVRGGKIDYCLRGQMRNLVLVEVKRAGTDLTEHQEQLLRYAFDEGVGLAVLTDGLVWWLYLPMEKTSWEQRRFFSTNIATQRPAESASSIYRFLNRNSMISGEALEQAKKEFESQERERIVRGALHKAWRQVLGDPQGLLPDLLAEAVREISGHAPDRNTITEFLQGMSGNGEMEAASPVTIETNQARDPRQHVHVRSVPGKTRRKIATKKMSARVEGDQPRQYLLVKFADGEPKQWKLPHPSDTEEIRQVRDAAVTFASAHGATEGQVAAVMKALTSNGYYVSKSKKL